MDRDRDFVDDSLIGQILARRGHTGDVKIAFEVRFNLGCRASFAYFAQVIEHGREQLSCPLQKVIIDRLERRLYILARLLSVEQVDIDCPEQRRIQLHRLWDHFTIRQEVCADHFDARERCCGIENPERGVVEIAPGDEPFVGLRMCGAPPFEE